MTLVTLAISMTFVSNWIYATSQSVREGSTSETFLIVWTSPKASSY